MVSNPNQFSTFVQDQRKLAYAYGHRSFVVLEPNESISETEIQAWLDTHSVAERTWHPGKNTGIDRADEINAILGTENLVAVYNACHGFDPRLFAATAGTVTAGGVFLLLVPPLKQWPSKQDVDYDAFPIDESIGASSRKPSLFIRRVIRVLCRHCTRHPSATNIWLTPFTSSAERPSHNSPSATGIPDWRQQQDRLLDQMVSALRDNKTQTLVVQADRGRGKSALLGRLAALLMQSGRSVAVTALMQSATHILQRHCQPHVPFLPIAQAINIQHDVLLVEEAGSLSLPVLQQLLSQSRHSVFATTVQGYEGAGRGFALRFSRSLDRLRPGWIKLTPTSPIRWQPDDPLEQLANDALLLNTPLPTPPETGLCSHTVHAQQISQLQLFADETLLQNVYSLLVQAHYQTTPLDLRHMLDKPGMTVWIMRVSGKVCAAALVATEGQIESSLHEPIVSTQRRLHNQLLPQLLAQCANTSRALPERYARIVRIAVHPQRQRLGLGSQLIQNILQQLASATDAIGTSFGADDQTLSFWLRQGFSPFHYGYRINPRSGLRSVSMLRSEAPITTAVLAHAQTILADNIASAQAVLQASFDVPLLLKSTLDSFDAQSSHAQSRINIDDQALLQRFADGQRSLLNTAGAIHRLHLLTTATENPISLRTSRSASRIQPTRKQVEKQWRHWVQERLR